MKHYEDKTIPECTKRVHTKTTCDMCQNEILNQYDAYSDVEYVYINIEHSKGYSSPYGCQLDVTGYDICVECFNNKLTPYFESLKVTPTKTTNDW